jgi:hypothetical protein
MIKPPAPKKAGIFFAYHLVTMHISNWPCSTVMTTGVTVDEVYRKPIGPASDPKSLYALLVRFVAWRRERNGSEATLKVQTHHQKIRN